MSEDKLSDFEYMEVLVNHFHNKLTGVRSLLQRFGQYGRQNCGCGKFKNIDDEYKDARHKLKVLRVSVIRS